MSLGEDPRDRLAYDLTETEFDAVERDGFRAEWTEDDRYVLVTAVEHDEEVVYEAEDLVRAASNKEVENARTNKPEANG